LLFPAFVTIRCFSIQNGRQVMPFTMNPDDGSLESDFEVGEASRLLKTEFLRDRPKALAEAKRMVDESVEVYNRKRPHQALKYKMPDVVHRAF